MIALINREQAAFHLDITISISDTDFQKYVKEATEFELKPLLPEKFYYDLLNNVADEDWEPIFDGGVYTYEGFEYSFEGIRKVLSYFTYARFILKDNIQSTKTGFVTKNNPHSTALTIEEREKYSRSHKRDGYKLFEDFKVYANRNSEIEELGNWDCGNSIKPERDFKIQTL